MRFFSRWAPAALALGLLSLAGGAGADATAPFLWQVDHDGRQHFLLGSVHLLPADAHPLPAALAKAYEAADGIVLESDLGALAAPETQLAMLSAARAATEQGLRGYVGAELYRRLAERAESIGMPLSMCEAFKPWFCALSLEVFNFQRKGFEAAYGVDQHFYARALADEKPVRWLESPGEQLRLFSEMPDELSQQFLAATVDELTEAGQSPADLLAIWQNGDLDGMARAGRDFRERHTLAYERLIAQRNRQWLPRLLTLFEEPAPLLVIVGAAHLAGPDNVIDLLRERGVKLAPYAAVTVATPP